MAPRRLAADLWIRLVGRTMVSQLVKHERIETTVAKVLNSSPWRSFERVGFVFREMCDC